MSQRGDIHSRLRVPFSSVGPGPKLTRSHSAPPVLPLARPEQSATNLSAVHWPDYSTIQSLRQQPPVSVPPDAADEGSSDQSETAFGPTDAPQTQFHPSQNLADPSALQMINTLRMDNLQKHIMIGQQATTIRNQNNHLNYQSNQYNLILDQMMYFRKQLELRDVELSRWKSIGDELHAWKQQRGRMEQQHNALRIEFYEHCSVSESMSAIQHDDHATDNAENAAKIEELSDKIDRLEARIHDLTITNKDLTAELNVLLEEFKLLETWTMDSDPVAFLKIKFRRLIDEAIKVLFEDVTGKKANDHHRNVKAWWLAALNLSNSTDFNPNVPLTTKKKDDIRFQLCLALLIAKNFEWIPAYNNLVTLGTLRYLTQITIDLCEQGNFHAHELPDMSSFRNALEKAKTDKIIDSICHAGDYSSLQGLINFVEAAQHAS